MIFNNCIISNSTLTGSYTLSNNTIGNGTYYYCNVSYDHSKYDLTDSVVVHRGLNLPVYISKSGRAFIFAINKRGCEYKKYLK